MEMHAKGRHNRWVGLFFICVSLLVISLDDTVLNVALPSISRKLGASASELQWIVDAYILIFAAMLLTMGSIGDRLGRKRALQAGVFLFGTFSLMAALSTSTDMLIVARGLLGIGGATIMPATLSLITAMFRDEKERAQAIAIWAAVFGMGTGFGPLVGGILLENFNWNAVFLINLPIAAIALIGGQIYLDESRDEHAPPPDIPGVLLSISGLFALVYGIIEAGVDGWGAFNVVTAFVIAAVLLTIFGWWESRAKNAMLPLYLFRNPSFMGANVAMTLMMFGLFGVLFFLSQYLQSVQGYSAIETGVRLLPMPLVIMVAAGVSARLAERIGTKITVGIGFLIASSSMLLLSQVAKVDSDYLVILGGLALLGIGFGLAMSPATNSIMGSVPVSKAGVGSAMNDTTRMVGGALGVAVLGTVMNNTYLNDVSALETYLPPQAYAAVSSSIQGAHVVAGMISEQFSPSIGDSIRRIANAAFVNGMTEALMIAGIVTLAASVFTFIVLPTRVRSFEEDCEDNNAVPAIEREAVPAAGD